MTAWTVRALRALQWIVSRIPRPIMLALCRFTGDLCYLFVGSARRRAIFNLRRALSYNPAGGLPLPVDPLSLRHVVRNSFRNQVINYYDLLRMPSLSTEEMRRQIDVTGGEYIDEAIANGRGGIFFSCHLGMMDYGPVVATQRGAHIIVPVEPLKNQALFDFFTSLRASHGYEVIASEPRILRRLLKALRENKFLCIVADRDFRGSGIPVKFFGVPTHMPAGFVALAIRTKAPLMHAIGPRTGDDRYTAIISPPLEFETKLTGDLEADTAMVMQEIVHLFEDAIRQYPDQWASFHKIWDE